MTESLSDKLRSLGVQIGTQHIAPKPVQPMKTGISDVLQGRYISTRYGDAFAVENFYPPDYTHGCVHFDMPINLRVLCEWGKVSHLVDQPLSNFIFLDTETTGLAGGTGTFVFLVGIGFWTGTGFQLMQLFLEEPASEAALMAALSEVIHPFSAVVTFNGKAFDIPLLNARHILNGFQTPFSTLDHLDLLQLARRLWRNRLASRALGNLEIEILRVQRSQEDIPGWMIPELYYDYLRSNNAAPLAGVFYHNAYDILSLAALFSHTARLLENPRDCEQPEGLDIMAIAQLHEEMGQIEKAAVLYEQALQIGLPGSFSETALMRFANLYRKQGNWEGAVTAWKQAAAQRHIDACVELAKYFEHQARSYVEALQWTEAALVQLADSKLGLWEKRTLTAELTHRQERLVRKSSKQSSG